MEKPKTKKLKTGDEFDNPFVYEKGVTDVVLKVGDLKIHVNKGTLMTSFQFFKDMFLLCDDKNDEIDIDENPTSFLTFLRCMYPSVWEPISSKNLDATLELADKYGISPPLLAKCDIWIDEYLRRNHSTMTDKDRIAFIEKAEKYDLRKTMSAAAKMMEFYDCSAIYESKLSNQTKLDICKKRLLNFEKHPNDHIPCCLKKRRYTKQEITNLVWDIS